MHHRLQATRFLCQVAMLFSKCRHHWVSGVSMLMEPPENQTWCVKRAMLQPLGLPLCLPSHFLSSIRVNTFLHPYLPPKKFLLHKASLAAHLLPFLHISIAFSLSSSYHQCPLPPHQLRILSPGLIFGMIIKKSRDVLATSGDSAGILDRGFIRHGKCDLGSSLRNCAGFLAIFFYRVSP